MRAARFHAPGDVRIEDVDEPSAGPGQVKLRVAANGVCGSDLHEYFAAQMMIPSEPHPVTGAKVPVILGHEFAGTVTEVGEGVASIATGDRVAVRPTIQCGQCASCDADLGNICQQIAFHGLSADTGGLAEYAVVAAENAHVLPEGVTLEAGALVEPLAVAHHAVKRSQVEAGDIAVVAGLGPIGIGVWLVLRALGVQDVILSDPSVRRRQAVTELGAEHVIDPTETDLGTLARELSGGPGARVVYDCAGVGAAINGGLMALAPHGQIVVIGLHEAPMPDFFPTLVVLGETSLIGSGTYDDSDFEAVIGLMADGAFPTDGWVEQAPLDELVAVFDQLRRGERIKVLVTV